MSSVFEYVYAFEACNGIKGILRADNIKEARDKVRDCYNSDVKAIVLLDDLDNDYGVIGQVYIDLSLKNATPIVQYSFDIQGEFSEDDIKKCLEEKLGAEVLGVNREATWSNYGYSHSESPIY